MLPPTMNTRLDRLRTRLQPLAVRLARWLGSDIVDHRTGQVLGRALLIAFRGKVHVIGSGQNLIPMWVPQERLTYWKQEIVFTAHPPPDFPHEPRP